VFKLARPLLLATGTCGIFFRQRPSLPDGPLDPAAWCDR